MKISYFSLLICLVAPLRFASQHVLVDEGEIGIAHISSQWLNRIAIKGDRISDVKGLAGEFQLDKDNLLGQIFLQPTLAGEKRSLHLFLTTEKSKLLFLKKEHQPLIG